MLLAGLRAVKLEPFFVVEQCLRLVLLHIWVLCNGKCTKSTDAPVEEGHAMKPKL